MAMLNPRNSEPDLKISPGDRVRPRANIYSFDLHGFSCRHSLSGAFLAPVAECALSPKLR